jgi:hypothetical protein
MPGPGDAPRAAPGASRTLRARRANAPREPRAHATDSGIVGDQPARGSGSRLGLRPVASRIASASARTRSRIRRELKER